MLKYNTIQKSNYIYLFLFIHLKALVTHCLCMDQFFLAQFEHTLQLNLTHPST